MAKNKSMKFHYLLAFIVLIALNSCKSVPHRLLFNTSSGVNIENIKDIYVENDQGPNELYYRIKEGDVIAIRNLQNKYWGGSLSSPASGSQSNVALTNTADANSVSYIVDNNGTVALPALKEKVKISGLTRVQARQKIEDLYSTGTGRGEILTDPIIELNVVNLKVDLFGEVAKQGPIPLTKDNTTLIDVISQAGGLLKTADPRDVRIKRGKETIYVNFSSDRIIGHNKLVLQNNDIIIVGQNRSTSDAEKIQRFNTIIQPILVVVNFAILLFTLTK